MEGSVGFAASAPGRRLSKPPGCRSRRRTRPGFWAEELVDALAQCSRGGLLVGWPVKMAIEGPIETRRMAAGACSLLLVTPAVGTPREGPALEAAGLRE